MSGFAVAVLLVVGSLIVGVTPALGQSPYGLIYQSDGTSVGGPSEFGLTANCPPNTTPVGGGYEDDGTAVNSSFLNGTGWGIEGFGGVNVGNEHPRATSSCAPPNLTPPLTSASDTLTLKPRLDPKGPHEGSAVANCASGSVAISGGYELDPSSPSGGGSGPSAVGLGATQPAGAGLGRGWEAAGMNTALLGDHWISAYANCLNAAVAKGIFRLYWDGNGEEMEDDSVTGTCEGGGGPLSGGARSTKDEDGGGYEYAGAFDGLSFNSARTGFTADYISGRPGKDFVYVSVLCGWVQPFVAKLTQKDFATACQQSYADTVGATPGKLATEWMCVSSDGSTRPLPSPQGFYACEVRGGDTATYLDIDDPLSWVCYSDPSSARSATLLSGKTGGGRRGSVRIAGRLRLEESVELERARVWMANVIHEPSRRGELFESGRGGGSLPVRLHARDRRSAARATTPSSARGKRAVVFSSRSSPRIKLRLRQKQGGKLLRFRIRAGDGRLEEPRHCASGSGATTRLTTSFKVEPRRGKPLEVEGQAFWECRARSLVKVDPPLP